MICKLLAIVGRDRMQVGLAFGQQLDGPCLHRGCFLTFQNCHFQHPSGPVVDCQQHAAVAPSDDQIHLQVAHPLLLFHDCRTLPNVHPAHDLAPFAPSTAPFSVALALGAYVAVELAAPLLVLPDELIDALVGNALNPLSGGVPDDLLGAVVLLSLALTWASMPTVKRFLLDLILWRALALRWARLASKIRRARHNCGLAHG